MNKESITQRPCQLFPEITNTSFSIRDNNPNFRLFRRIYAFPYLYKVRRLRFRYFTLYLMCLSLSV